MRIIETKVYQFEELSSKAKDVAINAARECLEFSDYAGYSIEDAKTIAALMGWDIAEVHYSGFYSQGDGACFVGAMHYKNNCLEAVQAYAPTDAVLHDVAKRWYALQNGNGFALSAYVGHSGWYSHEYCTEFECFDSRAQTGYTESTAIEAEIKEIAREFMHWIYKQLQNEFEFQTSDSTIAEMLINNDCEFTADGKII